MDKQLTLEEALLRIVENYKPQQKKPFKYSVPTYIQGYQFRLDYEKLISPREDMFKFHTYHIKDSGEVGHLYYCKECNDIVYYNQTKKGLEYEGKIVFFTNDEIDSLKQKKGLLITNFFYDRPIKPEIVKDSYALDPHVDKDEDETAWNKALYDVILDWMRTENKRPLVVAKMSSGGFKNGPDIGVLSYDKTKNRVMLNIIYYSDEINSVSQYTEGEYDAKKLKAAENKLFGEMKPLEEELKTPQIRRIFDIILSKEEPKKEEKKEQRSALDRLL
ncbi:MAG: Ku protein [Candidatus Acidifodinimicrobium sp.]